MDKNNAISESEAMKKPELQEIEQVTPPTESAGGGGWGGWGFSSVFSDLQKAAEEISRNAAEAAKTAAQSIADMQITEENSESSKEDEIETSGKEEDTEDKEGTRSKAALDKLENASEDTLLSQGLKVLDNSVENIASGAWQAFGNAWRGGSSFVQKLESSAASLADSINHGDASSVAPSLIETGKAFTARGIQVLEHVGKETMDLLIAETGIEVDKKSSEQLADEDQLLEEVTFDRYFYIYGGPEQLEELEALSSHYALLFNRRKTKLSSEQKSVYDSKLKQVQEIFSLSSEFEGIGSEQEKGKQVETRTDTTIDEMKNLHDSSVSKAAELAAGFASALVGQTPSDIIQRTAGRLDSLHSEGVHRLSEMCCSVVSQLLMIGKSVISNANKAQDNDADDIVKIDWPEDSIEKAKVIRIRVQSMTGKVEEVSNSFITGISEVAEACSAAIKAATTDSAVFLQEKPIEDKTHEFSENLRFDQTTAVGKIQDGLQYLSYLVIFTSMPAA